MTEKRSIDKDSLITNASAILLDIEGTTTPIDFVKETLFPYAKNHLEEYLKNNWSEKELQDDITLLREQAAKDVIDKIDGAVEIPKGELDDIKESVVKNINWQIDNDRKTKALKQLQGHIWRSGYKSGEIVSTLFEDVKDCLKTWKDAGKDIFIYSSGSVEAQKLLFGHTKDGDLLSFFSGFFDTEMGPKTESASYVKILENLKEKNHIKDENDIIFLTDVEKEAEAAQGAGIHSVIIVRKGNAALSDEAQKSFPTITTFSELTFEGNAKRRKLFDENVTVENSNSNSDNVSNDTEMEVCSNEKSTDEGTKSKVDDTNVKTDEEMEVCLNEKTSEDNVAAVEPGAKSEPKINTEEKVLNEKSISNETSEQANDENTKVSENSKETTKSVSNLTEDAKKSKDIPNQESSEISVKDDSDTADKKDNDNKGIDESATTTGESNKTEDVSKVTGKASDVEVENPEETKVDTEKSSVENVSADSKLDVVEETKMDTEKTSDTAEVSDEASKKVETIMKNSDSEKHETTQKGVESKDNDVNGKLVKIEKTDDTPKNDTVKEDPKEEKLTEVKETDVKIIETLKVQESDVKKSEENTDNDVKENKIPTDEGDTNKSSGEEKVANGNCEDKTNIVEKIADEINEEKAATRSNEETPDSVEKVADKNDEKDLNGHKVEECANGDSNGELKKSSVLNGKETDKIETDSSVNENICTKDNDVAIDKVPDENIIKEKAAEKVNALDAEKNMVETPTEA